MINTIKYFRILILKMQVHRERKEYDKADAIRDLLKMYGCELEKVEGRNMVWSCPTYYEGEGRNLFKRFIDIFYTNIKIEFPSYLNIGKYKSYWGLIDKNWDWFKYYFFPRIYITKRHFVDKRYRFINIKDKLNY